MAVCCLAVQTFPFGLLMVALGTLVVTCAVAFIVLRIRSEVRELRAEVGSADAVVRLSDEVRDLRGEVAELAERPKHMAPKRPPLRLVSLPPPSSLMPWLALSWKFVFVACMLGLLAFGAVLSLAARDRELPTATERMDRPTSPLPVADSGEPMLAGAVIPVQTAAPTGSMPTPAPTGTTAPSAPEDAAQGSGDADDPSGVIDDGPPSVGVPTTTTLPGTETAVEPPPPDVQSTPDTTIPVDADLSTAVG